MTARDEDPGFETIRTTLQSALRMPFAVAVSSSRIGDGKSLIATGAARAFAGAGFKTLIVDANPHAPAVARELGLAPLALTADLAAQPFTAVTSTPQLPDAMSIASFATLDAATLGQTRLFMAHAKEQYAVTIFDLADIGDCAFMISCCAAADGVVLAVRYGRRRHSEDRQIIAMIEGEGGTVIGSVPTRFRGS